MNTRTEEFTIGHGLAFQGRDLAKWKPRLSAAAYDALAAECTRRNAELVSPDNGYNVWRGQNLTEFLSNLDLAALASAKGQP